MEIMKRKEKNWTKPAIDYASGYFILHNSYKTRKVLAILFQYTTHSIMYIGVYSILWVVYSYS